MRSPRLALPLFVTLLAGCGDLSHSPEDETAAFERAYEENNDPNAGSCSGVRPPDQPESFGHKVALTFDDGPNPNTTPVVIEILRRYGIPATFFINGKNARSASSRAILTEMIADPLFLVGNHTERHASLPSLSIEDAARDIDATTEAIEAVGGVPTFFRFPYGAASCELTSLARDSGYTVTGWHIDSADWCYASANGHCSRERFAYVADELRYDMQRFVLTQVRRQEGGIVLFHDIHSYTAGALEAIVRALLDEGYTFVGLDDTATFPRLNAGRVPPPPFIGSACEGDEDCAFTYWDASGVCDPSGFCTMPCQGWCPYEPGRTAAFCVDDPESAEGKCVSYATGDTCAVPGTAPVDLARFIGDTDAPEETATVCAPAT